MEKQFINAKEVAAVIGVSVSKAYGIIKELNSQLKAAGYIVIPGRVNRAYFNEKCLYGASSGRPEDNQWTGKGQAG
ncbi:LysR family transcriptional regulator [Anaerostipes sp.]|uniref:LysR family transcriptional regulator n=1 Tax=Anaerostipes sp. TaxID=1872530 RepID=UPI0025C3CC03|nr:LysR family transcriptional regulator [Anaerostipes sp.]MBS7008471.1 LysR family transcriptional regulator [Anaerostipes sp.]